MLKNKSIILMFCTWCLYLTDVFLCFIRWIKMKHVKGLLKFHTCRNKNHYRRWTSLINRAGFTVGSSTRVCSNHFEHGRPSLDKPHPTLYLKGYPGISSLNEETPPKRKQIERTYKSPTKQRKAERFNAYLHSTYVTADFICTYRFPPMETIP